VNHLLCCLALLCLACALLGACGASGAAAPPPATSATIEPTPYPLCRTCDSYGRNMRETAAALRPTATAQP
jgi:hypothetical protein